MNNYSISPPFCQEVTAGFLQFSFSVPRLCRFYRLHGKCARRGDGIELNDIRASLLRKPDDLPFSEDRMPDTCAALYAGRLRRRGDALCAADVAHSLLQQLRLQLHSVIDVFAFRIKYKPRRIAEGAVVILPDASER